jgi:hypothetical protein
LKPWTVDARDIGNLEDISPEDIILTENIIQFIESDREHKYFIVGPKGFGKTLLLLYKRLLLLRKHTDFDSRSADILFIPAGGSLVDRGGKFLDFSKEKTAYLSKKESWFKIWFFCIALSVIKKIKIIYEQKDHKDQLLELRNTLKKIDPEIQKQLMDSPHKTPFDFLGYALKGNLKTLIRLTNNNDVLESILKTVPYSIAIFIDNVDQTLREHLEASYNREVINTEINHNGEVLSPEVWYAAQIGLVETVETLSGIARYLRVFASIRKEAYSKLETNDLYQQIESHTSKIDYKKDDLEKIFRMNIERMRTHPNYKGGLISPSAEDNLTAFLGLSDNMIKSETVKNEREPIFDYIYRHTLKRPRDLMTYGEKITGNNKITGSNKNIEFREKQIRDIIHETSIDIVKEYFAETGPHINFSEKLFANLLCFFDSNILTPAASKRICRKFNNIRYCTEICIDCKKDNPICNLYQIGLIGIIKETKRESIQEFLPPGCDEINVNKSKPLPSSKYYLVHPILNRTIENKQHESAQPITYRVNDKIIIGDGYYWNDSVMKPVNKRNRDCSFIEKQCDCEGHLNSYGVLLISSERNRYYIERLGREIKTINPHLDITSWKERIKPTTGRVFCHEVCPKIYENGTIIADITDSNPNVLFECGFGLGLGRDVILTCKNKASIRFEIGELYTTRTQILLKAPDMGKVINSLNLYDKPRIFSSIDNFSSPKDRKITGCVYILTCDPDQEIVKKLGEHYNYTVLGPKELELPKDFMPLDIVQKLLLAKAVLVNLSGKQLELTGKKINDARMMCLAGITLAQGIPTRFFVSGNDFYSDIRELRLSYSITDITSFVNNLQIPLRT